MKVTVCFGEVKVVVPCGDGDFTVREVITKAVTRYKKATGKAEDHQVDVHNLKNQRDGGILDFDDLLTDVVDDKDQILAEYIESADRTSPGNLYSSDVTPKGDAVWRQDQRNPSVAVVASSLGLRGNSTSAAITGHIGRADIELPIINLVSPVLSESASTVVVTEKDLSKVSVRRSLMVRRDSEPNPSDMLRTASQGIFTLAGSNEEQINTDSANLHDLDKGQKSTKIDRVSCTEDSRVQTGQQGMQNSAQRREGSGESESESDDTNEARDVHKPVAISKFLHNFVRSSARQSLGTRNVHKWASAQERVGERQKLAAVEQKFRSVHQTASSSPDKCSRQQSLNTDSNAEDQISTATLAETQRAEKPAAAAATIDEKEKCGLEPVMETARSVLVMMKNTVSDPLGIHVAGYFQNGREAGLAVHRLEPCQRIELDQQITTGDIIQEINGRSLIGIPLDRAKAVFRDQLTAEEISLRIIKCRANPAELPPLPAAVAPPMKEASVMQLHETLAVETNTALTATSLDRLPVSQKTAPPRPPARSPATRLSSTLSLVTLTTPPTPSKAIVEELAIDLLKGPRGLGFSISSRENLAVFNGSKPPIFIKTIMPFGAAVADGRLKQGDQLLEINGEDMTHKTQDEIVLLLRSMPQGSTVHFVVLRQHKDSENHSRSPRQPQLALSPTYENMWPKTESLHVDGNILTFDIPLKGVPSSGIGVSVRGETACTGGIVCDLGVVIKDVVGGGAADEDGRIQSGDKLLAINGKALQGLSNAEAMRAIRSAMSSCSRTCSITVARRNVTAGGDTQGQSECHHESLVGDLLEDTLRAISISPNSLQAFPESSAESNDLTMQTTLEKSTASLCVADSLKMYETQADMKSMSRALECMQPDSIISTFPQPLHTALVIVSSSFPRSHSFLEATKSTLVEPDHEGFHIYENVSFSARPKTPSTRPRPLPRKTNPREQSMDQSPSSSAPIALIGSGTLSGCSSFGSAEVSAKLHQSAGAMKDIQEDVVHANDISAECMVSSATNHLVSAKVATVPLVGSLRSESDHSEKRVDVCNCITDAPAWSQGMRKESNRAVGAAGVGLSDKMQPEEDVPSNVDELNTTMSLTLPLKNPKIKVDAAIQCEDEPVSPENMSSGRSDRRSYRERSGCLAGTVARRSTPRSQVSDVEKKERRKSELILSSPYPNLVTLAVNSVSSPLYEDIGTTEANNGADTLPASLDAAPGSILTKHIVSNVVMSPRHSSSQSPGGSPVTSLSLTSSLPLDGSTITSSSLTLTKALGGRSVYSSSSPVSDWVEQTLEHSRAQPSSLPPAQAQRLLPSCLPPPFSDPNPGLNDKEKAVHPADSNSDPKPFLQDRAISAESLLPYQGENAKTTLNRCGSLESMHKTRNELFPSMSLESLHKPRSRVIRGRGCNESFRTAVDHSYEAPLSLPRAKYRAKATPEEVSDSGISPPSSSSSSDQGVLTIKDPPASLNAATKRDRKPKVAEFFGQLFRFGRSRKSMDDRLDKPSSLSAKSRQDPPQPQPAALHKAARAAPAYPQAQPQNMSLPGHLPDSGATIVPMMINEYYKRLIDKQRLQMMMASETVRTTVWSSDHDYINWTLPSARGRPKTEQQQHAVSVRPAADVSLISSGNRHAPESYKKQFRNSGRELQGSQAKLDSSIYIENSWATEDRNHTAARNAARSSNVHQMHSRSNVAAEDRTASLSQLHPANAGLLHKPSTRTSAAVGFSASELGATRNRRRRVAVANDYDQLVVRLPSTMRPPQGSSKQLVYTHQHGGAAVPRTVRSSADAGEGGGRRSSHSDGQVCNPRYRRNASYDYSDSSSDDGNESSCSDELRHASQKTGQTARV